MVSGLPFITTMFNEILTRRSFFKLTLAGASWLGMAHGALAAGNTPVTEAREKFPMTPTEQMIYATVRIECKDKSGTVVSTGTGFFFRLFKMDKECIPVIITNKHVINGYNSCQFFLTRTKQDGTPDIGNMLRVDISEHEFSKWIGHDDPAVDIAVFLCAELFKNLNARNEKFFVAYVDPPLIPNEEQLDGLMPVEDILVVGYPDGIWDSVNNAPIFRRGITATAPYIKFNGRKEFLIDAAIFPGSSGSPVFLYNAGGYTTKNGSTIFNGYRVLLLGIVYAVAQHTINGEIRIEQAPTTMRPISISLVPNNLGVCIMSSRILEFEPLLVTKGVTPPSGYVMRAK